MWGAWLQVVEVKEDCWEGLKGMSVVDDCSDGLMWKDIRIMIIEMKRLKTTSHLRR